MNLYAEYSAVHILRLGADVVGRARLPFPGEPIRTLDALHIASAIIGGVNELIPLLEKEGWRGAPGWSVRVKRIE